MLRRIAAEGPEWYAALPEEDAEEAALRHSLPDWIAELWFERLRRGAGAGPVRCGQPRRPPLSLWPNPLLGGERRRGAWLEEAGATAARDDATGVLRVDGPLDVAGLARVRARRGGADRPRGRAGRPARRRRARACACSISARRRAARRPCSRPRGAQVTAVDAHPGRAKALRGDAAPARRRAPRSSPPTAATYAGGPFDRILVDAPCSGLGVLAGRPDARWRRTPEDADELAALQVELVAHARELLAPGGELHYAVCTLNPHGERGDRPGRGPGGARRAAHLARRGRRRLLRRPPRPDERACQRV